MRYRVRHITEYSYGAPVSLCYNMAHLLPRDTRNQRCLHQKVQINLVNIHMFYMVLLSPKFNE